MKQCLQTYRHSLPIFVIIALNIVFWYKVIFYDYILPWDISASYYAVHYYFFNSIEQGIFPLWISNYVGGVPFEGNPLLGEFYPIDFILYSLTLIIKTLTYRIFEVFFISQITLAGISMYFFSNELKISRISSLLAAIVFMCSSFFAAHVEAYSPLVTLIWLPLALLLTRRIVTKTSSPIWLSVILTLAFLASYPPAFLVLIIGVVGYYCGISYKCFEIKKIFRFILALATPIFLSAFYLIPAIQYALLSTPSHVYENPAITSITSGSNVSALITFIIPQVFGGSQFPFGPTLYYWPNMEITYNFLYMGILPLVLFFVGIRNCVNKESVTLLIIAAFGFFESFSNLSPFPNIFYHTPVAQFIRQWDYFALFSFGFSLISAKGLDYVRTADRFKTSIKRHHFSIIMLFVITACIIFFILIKEDVISLEKIIEQSNLTEGHDIGGINIKQPTDTIVSNFEFYLMVLILLLSLSLVLMSLLKTKYAKIVSLVIIGFVFADLFISCSGQEFNNHPYDASWATKDKAITPTETQALKFFKSDQSRYRIEINAADTLWGNGEGDHQLIHGIDTVGGYYNLPLKNYIDLLQSFRVWHSEQTYSNDADINSKFFNLFNTKYLLITGSIKDRWPDVNLQRWSLVYDDGTHFKIYKNNNYLNRTFIVPYVFIANDKAKAESEIASNAFSSGKYAVVNRNDITKDALRGMMQNNLIIDNPSKFEFLNSTSISQITKYTSNEIIVKTKSDKNGLLILSDIYYPGWKVTLDGKDAELTETDLALRGTYVPAGEHIIRFYFDPPILKLGIITSLLTLGGIILFQLKSYKKRKAKTIL